MGAGQILNYKKTVVVGESGVGGEGRGGASSFGLSESPLEKQPCLTC